MNKRTIGALLAVSALALAACGDDETDSKPASTSPATEAPTTDAAVEADIVAVATEAGSFNTLLAAATAAGLVETLQGEGPLTVFAPTDDAFAALPEGLVDALLLPENKELLASILTYHVVGAKVLAADVAPGAVASVQGEDITVTVDGSSVQLQGSDVLPPANVVTTDVMASNGVIHVIDGVILPPSITAEAIEGLLAPAVEETDPPEAAGDIVAVATEAGSFTTLLAAVEAAGLVEALQGEGPLTVFAPTDEAFAALPEGLVDALLLPENKDVLVAILTYHVVGAEVLAADVTAGDVETLQGESTLAQSGDTSILTRTVALLGVFILMTVGIVFVQEGTRRIPIISARRQVGRRIQRERTSYLPLRLNQGGVMPIIFASSVLVLPSALASFASKSVGADGNLSPVSQVVVSIANALSPGTAAHVAFYVVLIVFFSYFYSSLVVNPVDMAQNLKKMGASIPGIRPGVATSKYIESILARLTLLGAIFLGVVATVPTAIESGLGVSTFKGFGATSLLILVSVAIDTAKQIQTLVISQRYEGMIGKD